MSTEPDTETECKFCKIKIKSSYYLAIHQTSTLRCLAIQKELGGTPTSNLHECVHCHKKQTTRDNHVRHLSICKTKLKKEKEAALKKADDSQKTVQKLTGSMDERLEELMKEFRDYKKQDKIKEEKYRLAEEKTRIKEKQARLAEEKTNSEIIYLKKEILALKKSHKAPKESEPKEHKENLDMVDTDLEQKYQTLLVKHNSYMKNHRYVKVNEKGPCFYIIEDGSQVNNTSRKKFGIAGLSKTERENSIDRRLQNHRTIWPQLKVNFIIFLKEVDVLEKSIKRIFEKEINPNGHEIIEGVTTEQMVEHIHKWIQIMCVSEYIILSDERIKSYNNYVVTTVK